jgi:DNA-binding CsgD family transcriptional regulator
MLLALPVVASDGTVLGVCGLEVSELLFKLRHSPELPEYPGALVALAPAYNDGTLPLGESLVAGPTYGAAACATLRPRGVHLGMSAWTGPEVFVGDTAECRLYPRDSVHASDNWQVAMLIPAAEARAAGGWVHPGWPLGVVALLSLAAAIWTVRWFFAPMGRALDSFKSGGPLPRTRITEIDDLFAFLSALDAERDARVDPDAPRSHNEIGPAEFERRMASLSRAETAVFRLYVDGYDAKEAAALLCLSINTVKTHNRRIYHKLGVDSRRELMAHIRTLRRSDDAAAHRPAATA